MGIHVLKNIDTSNKHFIIKSLLLVLNPSTLLKTPSTGQNKNAMKLNRFAYLVYKN